ncbi:MAG TPA: hypothetical protein VEN28_04670 [Burkholderiaceae bacterium]|jgi:hypothetical protein|nr:hypothetical protein [Burkholderiaceae bacterium]
MKQQFEQSDLADAILTAEEAAAWTLDELDHSADLGSLRSAWTSADETNF